VENEAAFCSKLQSACADHNFARHLSRFRQARLKHESVPSLDRRVTYATHRYRTSQTKNYVTGLIHEAIVGKTVSTTVASCRRLCRQSPRAFTCNALGNAVRKLQSRHQCPLPRRRLSAAVNGTTARIDTVWAAVYWQWQERVRRDGRKECC